MDDKTKNKASTHPVEENPTQWDWDWNIYSKTAHECDIYSSDSDDDPYAYPFASDTRQIEIVCEL
jgi:hypothetical protein